MSTDAYERTARWRLQNAMRLAVRLMLGAIYGLRAVNVPRLDGPFILAPNHASFLDPMVVQLLVPRHVTFIMDGELYRHPLFNWFYRFWRVIPLPDTTRAAGAMKDALKAARQGRVVGIFPEGMIASDGRLQEGMAGVGTLMHRARVPVIPVAILGAYDVLPRRASFPRAGRLLVVFGDPIEPDAEIEDRREAARRLRDDVMERIGELSRRHASDL